MALAERGGWSKFSSAGGERANIRKVIIKTERGFGSSESKTHRYLVSYLTEVHNTG